MAGKQLDFWVLSAMGDAKKELGEEIGKAALVLAALLTDIEGGVCPSNINSINHGIENLAGEQLPAFIHKPLQNNEDKIKKFLLNKYNSALSINPDIGTERKL